MPEDHALDALVEGYTSLLRDDPEAYALTVLEAEGLVEEVSAGLYTPTLAGLARLREWIGPEAT